MRKLALEIQVVCHAGYQADEYPTRFTMEGRKIRIERVLRQWRTPQHRYFRVVGDDGRTYLLEQEIASGRWTCVEIGGPRG